MTLCPHCKVDVAPDKIGLPDRCLDANCPLLPRNRGPWAISAEQAAARQVEADRYVARIIARCIDPAMPPDAIVMKLARSGITSRDWLRIRPLLAEGANG